MMDVNGRSGLRSHTIPCGAHPLHSSYTRMRLCATLSDTVTALRTPAFLGLRLSQRSSCCNLARAAAVIIAWA